MQLLLNSDHDFVVKAGFLYVPLLFDPQVAEEIRAAGARDAAGSGDMVVEKAGRHFFRAAKLQSLVRSYADARPGASGELRRSPLRQFFRANDPGRIALSGKLRTILFQILPYFVRKSPGLKRTGSTESEILQLLGQKIEVEARYYELARRCLDTNSMERKVEPLQPQGAAADLPEGELIPAPRLQAWLQLAVAREVLRREREHWRQQWRELKQFGKLDEKSLAVLLYLGERGALEIDGFGLSRIAESDNYMVYVHTGEYALKDYYGRIYLFPDCRVALSTSGYLRPVVMDRYKHPFLFRYDSGQEICLRNFRPQREFTAANAIQALEEGINALFYGYNSRRRNGYHSLDQVTMEGGTVDFSDYRIADNHPKIVSGEIEVKNRYT